MKISELISTVSSLEGLIMMDPEWIEGVNWGISRNGHPEGKVLFHIVEVLSNIDNIKDKITYDEFTKLRLIALIHDSFKFYVDPSKPKIGSNHHASLAETFAKKYIQDELVLKIIKTHDDVYHLWKKAKDTNQEIINGQLLEFAESFKNELQLYYLFFKCDTLTGNKNDGSLKWVEEVLKDRINKVDL